MGNVCSANLGQVRPMCTCNTWGDSNAHVLYTTTRQQRMNLCMNAVYDALFACSPLLRRTGSM